MTNIPELWFDLSHLGFPGWQHSYVFEVTTNSAGSGVQFCTNVRMAGSDFRATIFAFRGGMYDAIKSHIEKVEALIARRTLEAA